MTKRKYSIVTFDTDGNQTASTTAEAAIILHAADDNLGSEFFHVEREFGYDYDRRETLLLTLDDGRSALVTDMGETP